MSSLNIHDCDVSQFVDREDSRRIVFPIRDIQNDSIFVRHFQSLYQINCFIHLTGLEENGNGVMTRNDEVIKLKPIPSFSQQGQEMKSFDSIE